MSKLLDDFRENILKVQNIDEESTIRELVNLVIDATIEFVEENNEEFNLYTKTDLEEAVEEGENNVTDNPDSYGLYSELAVNQSYDDGVSNVLDSPTDYDLYCKDDIEELKVEWLEEYLAEENSKW